jgi:hypothetical protein
MQQHSKYVNLHQLFITSTSISKLGLNIIKSWCECKKPICSISKGNKGYTDPEASAAGSKAMQQVIQILVNILQLELSVEASIFN